MDPNDLTAPAERAVNQCLNVQPGETVLVVTDSLTFSIGNALYQAALKAGAEALIMSMEPRKMHAEEPPAAIAAAMKAADVVFGATYKSISHTASRRDACAAGARIATLPGITEDIFIRGLSADYGEVAARSQYVADRLRTAATAHITTAAGTDLTLSIEDKDAEADTGLYHAAGAFGNLPAGEAACGQAHHSAGGRLVIDGSMAGVGLLAAPLTFTVKDGFVESIDGGDQAKELESLLEPYGKKARNIAEFGIGTNPAAVLTGNILEDEKILGTIHIALGNDMSYGGTCEVPLHLDGVVFKPTIVLDGAPLMTDGTLVEG